MSPRAPRRLDEDRDATFGAQYAAAYDFLYADKDYGAECDLLEAAFRLWAARPVRRVLDLGCGTGGHAIFLAHRGYDVVGVDRSMEMLTRARHASAAAGVPARFIAADLRRIRFRRSFDAALLMFAVLGYQIDDADVLSALLTARQHVADGGVVIFDVWYGPAVLALGPETRTKTVASPLGPLRRKARGSLEPQGNICRVDYRLSRPEPGGRTNETDERHRVRYFFADELGRLLHEAGLRLASLSAFPSLTRMPDTTTWNALVVATTVRQPDDSGHQGM